MDRIHSLKPPEVGGSPELVSAVPVLPALDIGESVSFYEKRLGFACEFRYDDYAGLERDGIQIHLWRCEDPRIPQNTSCRINVRGIDALYAEYESQRVIHPNGALTTKPWGLREFTIVDASGNSIVFSESPEAA